MASIYESLDINSIAVEFSSGWYQSLARAKEHKIDLNEYENHIQNLSGFYGNDFTFQSETESNQSIIYIPIIFHAVIDDINLLNTDPDNPTITFNPSAIIDDLNAYFQNADIQFIAAVKDDKGKLLSIPGLHIINGKHITELRSEINASTNSFTHRYDTDFVTPAKMGRGSSNSFSLSGVTLDKLYDDYQWSPDKFLNIFLVTYLNSTPNDVSLAKGKVIYTSENPYIADMAPSGLKHFNITLPFFVLDDIKGGNRYGYNYPVNHPALSKLKESGSYAPSHNRARFLAKALGEMFGLAPLTSFTQSNTIETIFGEDNEELNPCRASQCVWTDYRTNALCGDCLSDTSNVEHPFAWQKSNLCFDPKIDIENNGELNIMYNRSKIAEYDSSAHSLNQYAFTRDQIIRMRVNMDLMYYDTDTGTSTNGVLKSLVEGAINQMSSNTIAPVTAPGSRNTTILSNPCDSTDNSYLDRASRSKPKDIFNTSSVFNNIPSKKLSLEILKIAEYNNYLENFENKEASKFKMIKDKIYNTINFSK